MKENKYKSSIPKGCTEKPVKKNSSNLTKYPWNARVFIETKQLDLYLDSVLAGIRQYNENGILILETPIKNGKKDGTEYTFYDSGGLQLAEPYVDGQIHGMAYQYSESGKLMGTYTMEHGTGYDIWRHESMEDDALPAEFYVCEIHSMKDGLPHGFEWWLNEDQKSVDSESALYEGKLHGIWRQWNFAGKLSRGFPQYYINDEKVDKRKYLRACEKDPTLPKFKEEDNMPYRIFPPEIEKILKKS